MDEYIERKKAIHAARYTTPMMPSQSLAIVNAIESIPAADVRPVVLCRDCKWYEINELKKDGTEDRRYKPSVCVLAEQRRDPNHFCADGKKREES